MANNAMPLIEQNQVVPLTYGGTFGFALGTAPTTVLTVNTQTRRVTFHNPGTVPVFVCQALDANGNALTPGPNPGNWAILPGASFTFTGNGVAGAWLAAAASGSGNPFTVAASQSL